MDLIVFVHVVQSRQDLLQNVNDDFFGELARNGLQHRTQISSVHPLHNKVKFVDAFLVPLVGFVDANDIFVSR